MLEKTNLPMNSEEGIELIKEALANTIVELYNLKIRVSNLENPEKPLVDKAFADELIKLQKIGIKTAEDIISLYPTKLLIVEAIREGLPLPWDDDVVDILRRTYGN